MKKRIGIVNLVLVMLFLLLVSVGCQSQKQSSGENQKAKETELLFSFDSYQEIVGAKIQLGNQFGATTINADDKYITQGEGSWLVKPQGNYQKPTVEPYFTFNCNETTFKNSDFTAYDKLMLDVYNASDEAATIRWSFVMRDDLQGKSKTQFEEYTLAPNDWTTCEYDLTSEAYGTFFHSDKVENMTVSFLDTKKSRDDAVKELYIDNLRGHYSEEECEIVGMDFDLSEGLTFENVTDQYVFSTNSLAINKCDLSRVAYEDTMLEDVDDSFGEYCLVGDATGAIWPAFTLKFDKTYEKDMLFSYWVYVEVDEEKIGDAQYTPACFVSEGDRTQYKMMTGNSKYNRWIQVYGVLPAAVSTTWTYLNMDINRGGKGTSPVAKDEPVTVYMDNFKIMEYEEYISVAEDGTVTAINPYNRTNTGYVVQQSAQKGDVFSFDIDFNVQDTVSIWILGDGEWKTEWYAKRYAKWDGQKHVAITVPQDTEYLKIVFGYGGESGDYRQNIATIKNIKIQKNWKVDNNGNVTMFDYDGSGATSYTYNQAMKKNEVISFDVDVKPTQSISVWVLGDGMWKTEWYAKKYNEWTGKTSISVKMPQDTENLTIVVGFNDKTKNPYDNVAMITNLKTGKNKVVLKEDGTVLLQNDISGGKNVSYKYEKSAKKGQVISFAVDVTPAQSISVWLLGDGMWKTEWYAKQYKEWNGKTTINVSVPQDTENFTVVVGYNDTTQDFKKNVVTISDVTIGNDSVIVSEDGTVTLQNDLSGKATVKHVFKQSVVSGETIAFDVDVTPAQNVSIWLLGCDSSEKWANEWYAKQYKTWSGKTRITVTAAMDIEEFTVVVKYNDTEQNFKENVVTISNVKIGKDTISVGEDGTIELQNNITGNSRASYKVEQAVMAGKTLTFDISVTPVQNISVWVHGYTADGKANEWFAWQYKNGVRNQSIAVTMQQDVTAYRIMIAYNDATQDFMQNKVTITNLTVRDSDFVTNQDGSITVYNGAGNRNVLQTIATGDFKKGDTVNFDIDFNMDEVLAIYVRGCDANGTNLTGERMHAAQYTWDGRKNITAQVDVDGVKSICLFIQYRKYNNTVTTSSAYKDNVATISNVKINTVVLANPKGADRVTYTFNQVAKKGQTVTFDIDVTPAQNVSVFFYGTTAEGNKEWFAWNYKEGTNNQTIAVEMKADVTGFKYTVLYNDATQDRTKNITTISNVTVRNSGVVTNADGSLTVYNGRGSRSVTVPIATGDFHIGDIVSFDVDFNMDEVVAIYVRGRDANGTNLTGERMHAAQYTWNGKKTITAKPLDCEGVKTIEVSIQYRKYDASVSTSSAYRDNVATLSNIQVD